MKYKYTKTCPNCCSQFTQGDFDKDAHPPEVCIAVLRKRIENLERIVVTDGK